MTAEVPVVAGMKLTDPAAAPAMTGHDDARTALLRLARADGGILTGREVPRRPRR
jgi:hypothetical protein